MSIRCTIAVAHPRIAYSYTDNGKKTRTTWARGVWKQHVYNERNLVSGTTYSGADTPSVAYTYADSGKTASATLSDGTSYAYGYDDRLLNTNESITVVGEAFSVNRTFDDFRRAQETAVVVTNVRHAAKVRLYDSEDRVCGYALTNAAGRGVSVSLGYDGSYLTNMTYVLPNGCVFTTRLTREAARRNLVTRRDYFFGGQSMYWYSTEYDLLNRPTNATDSVSLVREWLYNRRSELAAASVGTNRYGYAYDTIGNRLWSAANSETNSYTANSLNQYTAVSAWANPVYDADGNMTSDGTFSYSYDAENRLLAAYPLSPVVGSLAVENRYDHRHRRSRKIVKQYDGADWETKETHTFVWDGNNIVLERVEFANGASRTFEYFWGSDKSGSEQGAGGVEGLLAVSMDGVFYIPCYDHNGNIVLYVSETGSIAAQYVYDPYGNVEETYGNLAEAFSFGFSTKYHDRETGMVGYKRRFYRPDLGRWLNRDPIEEEGGENLYAFCANNPIFFIDISGESFWGYFVDTAKTLSGAFTMAAGFTLGAAAGWTGIGAVGAVGLIAMGADQFTSGVRNLVNRAQGRSVSNNTYVQIAYKYAAEKITGRTDSGLEKTLDGLYFAAEVVSACATGAMSISGSITAVRSVGTAHTAHRWVSVNGYVRMELYMTASVSTVEAGGVVATETFSTTLSAISFFTSPTNDVESVNVEGVGNDY